MRVKKHWNRSLRSSRSCIPRNIQGQVRQGSEQPDLVKNAPFYCRGRPDLITCKGTFQYKPFYDSTFALFTPERKKKQSCCFSKALLVLSEQKQIEGVFL